MDLSKQYIKNTISDVTNAFPDKKDTKSFNARVNFQEVVHV